MLAGQQALQVFYTCRACLQVLFLVLVLLQVLFLVLVLLQVLFLVLVPGTKGRWPPFRGGGRGCGTASVYNIYLDVCVGCVSLYRAGRATAIVRAVASPAGVCKLASPAAYATLLPLQLRLAACDLVHVQGCSGCQTVCNS